MADPGVPGQHGPVAQPADFKGHIVIYEIMEKTHVGRRPATGKQDLLPVQGSQRDESLPVLPLAGVGTVELSGFCLHILIAFVSQPYILEIRRVGGYGVNDADSGI